MSYRSPNTETRSERTRSRWIAASAVTTAAALVVSSVALASRDTEVSEAELAELLAEAPSLDGTGNHRDDPDLGAADRPFARVTAPSYIDGISALDPDRPIERYLSNRVFNDDNQMLVSANGVTPWAFVWGQFIDHTITLSGPGGDDDDNPNNDVGDEGLVAMRHDATDRLEMAPNSLGIAHTFRSRTVDGTGEGTGVPAEQVNELSSYIDASNVYGTSAERLDWLRDGDVDGDPTNNEATLLTADGFLPRVNERQGVDGPHMDRMGRLFFAWDAALAAGDERANEHVALTAVHTLFVREHNRVVEALPNTLDEETKFAIARRVIAATQQFITYEEFLPAMGVALDDYDGYDPTVDPSVTNEFATVGFRAHSQIPGSLSTDVPDDQVTADLIELLEAEGVDITTAADGSLQLEMPLNVIFGNPGLLPEIGLGNLSAGLASEPQRANDEQIDNQLRSVLFQLPGPDVDDPRECLDESKIDSCFTKVNDLGALDVFRTHDHGIGSYNELRAAFGLSRVTSFTEITGETTEQLPDGLTIDDPEIMDIVAVFDADGTEVEPDSNRAVTMQRRSTLAARLAAIFGSVDDVDARRFNG